MMGAMAGGGWSKSSGRKGSLTERGIITPPDGTPVGPRAAPPALPTGAPGPVPTGTPTPTPEAGPEPAHDPRHCWVDDPPGFPGRWPGVVAQWRRAAQGWEGRAVVVIRDPGPVVLDVWLPASQLTPA